MTKISNQYSLTNVLTADTTNGRVGIGTASPSQLLEVNNGTQSIIKNVSGTRALTLESYASDWNYLVSAGNNLGINVGGAYALVLNTNSAERMRITSAGNVGIGTSSPSATLAIKAYDAWISINGTRGSGAYTHEISTSGANNEALKVIGAVYMYCVANTNGVYLNTNATSWTSASDERLKDINSHITNAVDSVMSLRAVKYNWKSDKTKQPQVGLIAQDVQAVLPEAVSIEPDEMGTLGVKYTEVIPLLVAAIKEQQKQINELKALINA